ncbi:hypothetical protein [Nocardia rhamnosiphila]
MSTQSDIDAAREYYDTHSVADKIADAVPGDPANTSAMSGYSVRLPTDVLNQARKLASERGMTTGAWLREAIEKQVTASKPRTEAHTVDASTFDALRDVLLLFVKEVMDSRSPLDILWGPEAGRWKVEALREWNTAHRHDLTVDSLIAGVGGPSTVPKNLVPGITETRAKKKKPGVKVFEGRTFWVTDGVVRSGRPGRTADAVPAPRRRRRTII